MTDSTPTVVLVHGAFADASGFAGVIRELEAGGLTTVAPPNPLRGLHADADHLHTVVAAIDGPVVLVGHSYGGAVITQASATLPNVTALVYTAAFALDEGESATSVQEAFPAPLLATSARPSAYLTGTGDAEGPEFTIDRAMFRDTFCADLPADVADVMAATQRPLALAGLTDKCDAAGWKTRPSWYLVSAHDRAIHPDTERFMAARTGATTETIDGSHCAFVSRPVAVAAFIRQATG